MARTRRLPHGHAPPRGRRDRGAESRRRNAAPAGRPFALAQRAARARGPGVQASILVAADPRRRLALAGVHLRRASTRSLPGCAGIPASGRGARTAPRPTATRTPTRPASRVCSGSLGRRRARRGVGYSQVVDAAVEVVTARRYADAKAVGPRSATLDPRSCSPAGVWLKPDTGSHPHQGAVSDLKPDTDAAHRPGCLASARHHSTTAERRPPRTRAARARCPRRCARRRRSRRG